MQISWLELIGAAVLLFIPASWIYPASAKERLTTYHSARFRLERMLETWQHWFDLIRAYGAGYFLLNFAVTVDAATAEPSDRYLRWILIAAILLVAVGRQTVQYRQVFYFTAPVFYLWGLTLALMEPFPAIFAIVFSTIFARMARHVELKLILMACFLAAAGGVTRGFSFELLIACGLILLPLIIALASMNQLVCYTRGLGRPRRDEVSVKLL